MARIKTGATSMRSILREMCEIYVNFAPFLVPLITAIDPELAAALKVLVTICISSAFTAPQSEDVTN